ncbi:MULTISPECIES: APC family permease [unclassified Saccharopolyspora]|uniref:APC family permease n=1 Tax=unclassified Saccharopolyspora TaxID=2646250 RepID=UPI001CD568DC|nr:MULTISPECIES: APC family permease [unclassified Saccharopolyspora]MCA1187187.1 APC family permease [Saccharopolyspora sp. 6T]MCA1194309.1 APC family permease [Saccharopolyspora sp. 6V]MCA1229747.1 APC family permease [Saccharopolyspora sp. 6M]
MPPSTLPRSAERSPRPGPVANSLAASRLGMWSIIFFTVAAAAPETVVGGGAVSGFAVSGVNGIPVGYLAVAVVLGLFAVGYVAMSRHVENAGAFYAYIAKGLGRTSGTAAGGVAVLAYAMVQVSLVGGCGVGAADFLHQAGGPALPWWVFSGVGTGLVAVLGVLRIDVNGRVLGVLLLAEIAMILLYDLAFVTDPAAPGVTLTTLNPLQLGTAAAGVILVIAFTGFIGFENSTVLAEEARDPRTVGRATYLSLALIGGIYGLSTWALTVATGPDRIVAAAGEHSTELMFVLAADRLPPALVTLGSALYVTSLFAGMLSFHHVCARYLFALGREGIGPRALGVTSPRTSAPTAGSVTQSVVTALVVALFAVTGWDPIVHLFFWGASGGALGVLCLVTATSFAVVGYFLRVPGHGCGRWRTLLAPGIAAVVLTGILVLTLRSFGTVLGLPPGSAAAWALPGAYLAVALAGFCWGAVLRVRRPDAYARIGMGARSATIDRAEEPGDAN